MAAVVTTLALGIGANAAMFSVLRAVLLQPLPYANGDRIVRLHQPNAGSELTGLSPLEMADYRAGAPSIEAIVEYHSMPFTFIGDGEPQRLQTGVVSADFFDALGVRPVVGRGFRAGEDRPGSDPVLLLSWEYWQREYGGDPAVVGSRLRMNDRTHTVVGVLPRFPQYPNENDVYMPASSCPFRSAPAWAESRTARQTAFALLRAEAGHDAAIAELRTVAARLHAEHPEAYPAEERFTITAAPLAELMARDARPSIVMLIAATGFLLLIVCANVVNLAIVRLLRRRQELATRIALGASPSAIVRQLLTESSLLALPGAALGLIVARVILGSLVPFVARHTPRAQEIQLDGAVLAFAAVIALAAGLLGGVLPALGELRQMGAGPGNGSGSVRTTAGAGHGRLRAGLVVVQVAVAFVLLVGAGLTIRSLLNLQRVDPGFDPERVLTARVDPNWTRYPSVDAMAAFFGAVEARLAAQPAVQAVAFASSFPLNGDPAWQIEVVTDADDPRGGAVGAAVAVNTASSGYFDVLGLPVLQGRALVDDDGRADAPFVAVLTRRSAELLFGAADPVGRRISDDGGETWGTVVGVVGNLRQELEGDYEAMVFAHQYRYHTMQAQLLVRGDLPPASLERLVRDAVAEVDRQQPVTDVRTIGQVRDSSLAPRRVVTALLVGFAALALAIAAVGLGGNIAFAVADRTPEIGIRVALGASQGAVIRLVLRQTLLLTACGLAIGSLLALLGARLLASFLFGVPQTDAATMLAVAAALFAVATLAGAGPARRALRIEPVHALRRS